MNGVCSDLGACGGGTTSSDVTHSSHMFKLSWPPWLLFTQMLFDLSGMVEVVSWSPSGELTRVSCSPAEALLIEDSQPPEVGVHLRMAT